MTCATLYFFPFFFDLLGVFFAGLPTGVVETGSGFGARATAGLGFSFSSGGGR